jgi:hypothetical protein
MIAKFDTFMDRAVSGLWRIGGLIIFLWVVKLLVAMSMGLFVL